MVQEHKLTKNLAQSYLKKYECAEEELPDDELSDVICGLASTSWICPICGKGMLARSIASHKITHMNKEVKAE
jgi:hypothetical protein